MGTVTTTDLYDDELNPCEDCECNNGNGCNMEDCPER